MSRALESGPASGSSLSPLQVFSYIHPKSPAMKFLHQPFTAKAGQRIIVTFNRPTRVLLIHSTQFPKYKGGRTYKYFGGFMEQSPAEFDVPSEGVWHAIIEKGTLNNPIEIKATAKLAKMKHKTLNGGEEMETHKKLEEQYDDTLE